MIVVVMIFGFVVLFFVMCLFGFVGGEGFYVVLLYNVMVVIFLFVFFFLLVSIGVSLK